MSCRDSLDLAKSGWDLTGTAAYKIGEGRSELLVGLGSSACI